MNPQSTKKKSSITLKDVPPALSAGLVIGLLVVFVEVSFAAMIFSGELDIFVAQGIGILLLGGLIIGIVVALTSSFTGTIALPQDSPVAIMGVVAAAIVAGMPNANPEQQFATVVGAMMVSSILTGILFWFMGRFNLGRLVRFIPYPVVGGFLAGMGWLLIIGSIGVMTDAALGPPLFTPDVLIRWLPGFLFAVILLVLLRRYSHFLLMPALLLAGVGLFYLLYFLSNGTVNTALADGWLLGPFPTGSLFKPVTGLVMTQTNWPLVLNNVIDLSTIFIVGSISFLLNASGLEVAVRKDIDLNRELKSVGAANVLAGIGGSPAGYHALSLSALGFRLGAHSRLVGLFSAAVVGFALFLGAGILSVFPRMIAGGFLLFLGLSFLVEWLYDAWFKLPKVDYALIWVITITIATVGLLEGVAVGILVAVLLFVVTYGRTQVVRHTISGKNYQSHVMRSRLYEQLLQQRGDGLIILELQGFIFFGTAYRLVDEIKTRIENQTLVPTRFLLLDFRLVTGIDTSTILSFAKLRQLLEDANVNLIFTHLNPEIQAQLQAEVLTPDGAAAVQIFLDLDQGVAWCEEQMIADFASVGLGAKPKTLLQYLNEALPEPSMEIDWLDNLNPLNQPKESPHIQRLLTFMQCIEAAPGTVLLREGQEVDNLYFVEAGQIVVQTLAGTGQVKELRILKPGTVIGEIGMYTGHTASATVVVQETAVLYTLSAQNFKRMESEDPTLAFAIHRLIAGMLGRKLSQTSQTVRALQN